MRSDRRWWFGLLTLVPVPVAMVCLSYYGALHEPMRRGEVSAELVGNLHVAGILLLLAGIVASLIVIKEAPGWWKLTGLPGLALNGIMFPFSMICL